MNRRPRSADTSRADSVEMPSRTQRFCKECGAAVHDANFCPRCGLATDNQAHELGGPAGVPPTLHAPHGRRRTRWWMIIGALGAAVVIGLVAAFLAFQGNKAASQANTAKARQALSPVVRENQQLASTLGRLSVHSGRAQASGSVRAATTTVQSAHRSLTNLTPAEADRAFAARAKVALTSELAWLHAAGSVLKNPASPMVGQLSSLGQQARSKLQAIDS